MMQKTILDIQLMYSQFLTTNIVTNSLTKYILETAAKVLTNLLHMFVHIPYQQDEFANKQLVHGGPLLQAPILANSFLFLR